MVGGAIECQVSISTVATVLYEETGVAGKYAGSSASLEGYYEELR